MKSFKKKMKHKFPDVLLDEEKGGWKAGTKMSQLREASKSGNRAQLLTNSENFDKSKPKKSARLASPAN